MRISDWSSDVCSSDLPTVWHRPGTWAPSSTLRARTSATPTCARKTSAMDSAWTRRGRATGALPSTTSTTGATWRSEEHKSELQSLMRLSYAVFCLKKNKKKDNTPNTKHKNENRAYIHARNIQKLTPIEHKP